MSIHTLQDLCYAYAVADPVREMLFALQDRITELEAQRKPLTHIQAKELVAKYGNDPFVLVYQTERAHNIKEGT
jgi:hypothetical protein